MSSPVVTVICLCHNQARFVREALQSVMDQTHPDIQLLVVDDGSTDNSVDVIREYLAGFPAVKFFAIPSNVGNCTAFNYALAHAEGAFIIDLAADDILMKDRVAEGVSALNKAGDAYGVNFTDACWIDENGGTLYRHSERFPHETIPQGDVYIDLVQRFFICSPTMMFRTTVIRALDGYDESLAYEDFDFWIRSSREFLYCYTPAVLVKKRIVKNSMSQRQFRLFSPQLRSTFRICEKIFGLNRSAAEREALAKRIRYEMRVCLRLLHIPLLFRYAMLLFRNSRSRY